MRHLQRIDSAADEAVAAAVQLPRRQLERSREADAGGRTGVSSLIASRAQGESGRRERHLTPGARLAERPRNRGGGDTLAPVSVWPDGLLVGGVWVRGLVRGLGPDHHVRELDLAVVEAARVDRREDRDERREALVDEGRDGRVVRLPRDVVEVADLLLHELLVLEELDYVLGFVFRREDGVDGRRFAEVEDPAKLRRETVLI